MKKINHILAFVLVVMLLVATSTTALAMTTSVTRYFPYNDSNKLRYTNEWKRIAYSTGGGLDCNVMILTYCTGNEYTDVRLCGPGGVNDVLWEESRAIQNNKHKTFYCGTDVYSIWVKTNLSGYTGDAWAYMISS